VLVDLHSKQQLQSIVFVQMLLYFLELQLVQVVLLAAVYFAKEQHLLVDIYS
jgi:hypothetical protein